MPEPLPRKDPPAIRLAVQEDLETLVVLLARQFTEHEIALPVGRLRQALKIFLRDMRWGFILVAWESDTAIGVACVSFTLTLEHGGKSAWLDELYVIPDRREAGVGTALVRQALLTAREEGCLAMDLEVESAHERAENLYQRAGFLPLTRNRWARKF